MLRCLSDTTSIEFDPKAPSEAVERMLTVVTQIQKKNVLGFAALILGVFSISYLCRG